MVRQSLTAFKLPVRAAALVVLGYAAGVGCTIELTGLAPLEHIGREVPDYGLYSYVILIKNTDNDDRSGKFLGHVYRSFLSTEDTAVPHARTNIFYIPSNKINKCLNTKELAKSQEQLTRDFEKRTKSLEQLNHDLEKLYSEKLMLLLGGYYAKNCYNYIISNKILNDNICSSPTEEIKAVCDGDLSRGPYIFTYAKPASNISRVLPPFLFMDLSDVHERAFPEIIAAFKAQVKRKDFSDRAKIDTLRLRVLSIALTAADWLVPVQKAMANIVYSPSGHTDKDKQ
jgi:hypothetical protein